MTCSCRQAAAPRPASLRALVTGFGYFAFRDPWELLISPGVNGHLEVPAGGQRKSPRYFHHSAGRCPESREGSPGVTARAPASPAVCGYSVSLKSLFYRIQI